MSFVFVSHASADKPKITHIFEALIAAGLKVWIDNPSKISLPDKLRSGLYRIRAGGRWEDEIDDAKRQSHCILVCWSKLAVTEKALALEERHVWFEEASYGRTEKKLVACTIDDLNPQNLPGTHSAQQMPCVAPEIRDPTALQHLVDDVKRKIAEYNRALAPERPERDPFIPYLADRDDQEQEIGAVVDAVLDGKVGDSACVWIAGPDNECIDEFMVRIRRFVMKNRLGQEASLDELKVNWPVAEKPRERFEAAYRRSLANALGLSRHAASDDIVQSFSQLGHPTLVVSMLHGDDWRPDEQTRLKAWLDIWHELFSHASHLPVVPVVRLKLPPAKAGWSANDEPFPPGRNAAVPNDEIWKHVSKLPRPYNDRLILVPVLDPVGPGHADEWVNQHFPFGDPAYDAARHCIQECYSSMRVRKLGLPHRDFVVQVSKLFRGSDAPEHRR